MLIPLITLFSPVFSRSFLLLCRCEPAAAEDAVELGEAILSEHVTPLLESLSTQLQSVVRAHEKATALEVRSLQQQEAGVVAIEKIGQQLTAMHSTHARTDD